MWDIIFYCTKVLLLFFFSITFMISITLIMAPLALLFATWFMRVAARKKIRRTRDGIFLAFFHPYCNAGGGGERVLWVAIKAILTRYPTTKIYVYTGDNGITGKEILDKVHTTFNVKLDVEKVNFIYLHFRGLLEAKHYPYFTLLFQSLGSMILGFEALLKLNPDIVIDTIGCAFTMPIFKYLGPCKTATYTHYPIITDDMMRRVKQRIPAHNNKKLVSKNPLLTWMKILYYQIFGWIYGMMGRCADTVMVNGTWTEEHINKLWNVPLNTHRVYPPCEVSQLRSLESLVKDDGPIVILSVAQYRPEKDHPLMLQSLYELRNYLIDNDELWNRIKLIFVGSCRNEEDHERVKNLQDLCKHLSLDENVTFKVNVSYSELLQIYQTATIGLHAMWNEHFGISVVESMAAGLIMVAHRSGGPLCDIIETSEGSQNGFLASDPKEYARAILEIVDMTKPHRESIVNAARSSVNRFSQMEFEKAFIHSIEPLMKALES